MRWGGHTWGHPTVTPWSRVLPSPAHPLLQEASSAVRVFTRCCSRRSDAFSSASCRGGGVRGEEGSVDGWVPPTHPPAPLQNPPPTSASSCRSLRWCRALSRSSSSCACCSLGRGYRVGRQFEGGVSPHSVPPPAPPHCPAPLTGPAGGGSQRLAPAPGGGERRDPAPRHGAAAAGSGSWGGQMGG